MIRKGETQYPALDVYLYYATLRQALSLKHLIVHSSYMQNMQNMLSKKWKKQIRRDARSIYCYNYQTL